MTGLRRKFLRMSRISSIRAHPSPSPAYTVDRRFLSGAVKIENRCVRRYRLIFPVFRSLYASILHATVLFAPNRFSYRRRLSLAARSARIHKWPGQ